LEPLSAIGQVEKVGHCCRSADRPRGLVFARQLLVTGLPQGPFLVATTVRGLSTIIAALP
jgi:hypothetical protein